ncbi:peptidylprolyl isomerase [Massilia sp. W12]|uniref:peptidylprolyl isomerase n=1 Tax=Massilia sp. W12 TaxID=3126507 RepID=UPI0030D19CA0
MHAANQIPSVNGVLLLAPGETLDAPHVQQRACYELLRQRALQCGLLTPQQGGDEQALQTALEALLQQEAPIPQPGDAECRRYYQAHLEQFRQGQARHMRHILFALTPRTPVDALAQQAEQVLLELLRQPQPPGRFAELAREYSNCPSAREGGDLGWIEPAALAPELAQQIFLRADAPRQAGIHPRLLHSRFGLHIVDILALRVGVLPEYEQVAPRIALQLQRQAEARALRQYVSVLAAQAELCGVDLDAAASPLLQ